MWPFLCSSRCSSCTTTSQCCHSECENQLCLWQLHDLGNLVTNIHIEHSPATGSPVGSDQLVQKTQFRRYTCIKIVLTQSTEQVIEYVFKMQLDGLLLLTFMPSFSFWVHHLDQESSIPSLWPSAGPQHLGHRTCQHWVLDQRQQSWGHSALAQLQLGKCGPSVWPSCMATPAQFAQTRCTGAALQMG